MTIRKVAWNIDTQSNPLFSIDTELDIDYLSDALKNEEIHSCLISVNNEVVFQYFKNQKLEKKQHKINSCTKSVTSCLIGITHEKGFIPDLDMPIHTYFPAVLEDQDSRKQLITIDHLLKMTAGFDWPELGEWEGWPHMIHSPNWVKYVLERPLLAEPGETMNYNSGCSQLLSAIVQKTTGLSTSEFAVRHLFSPLEFDDFIWHKDLQGVNIGGFGLHMNVQDMHKLGELYLNKGKWKKKQLISSLCHPFADDSRFPYKRYLRGDAEANANYKSTFLL